VRGSCRRFDGSSKAIGKDLALAGRVIATERLEDDVISALRIWSPIKRAVKRYEHAFLIARRKLFFIVAHHAIGRPVRGEHSDWNHFIRANAYFFAITAVLGRQNQLFNKWIVVAFRPAVIGALFEEHELFSR
jgi:hypothetical protein